MERAVVKVEYGADIATLETSTGKKQKREGKSRSKVWEHFTKLENKPGQREECMCNYCENTFASSNTSGTTHLQRHIQRSCPIYKKDHNEDKSQSHLCIANGSLEQDDEVIPWKLDQDRSLDDLTELIISWELPFNFVEDPSFQKYIWGICPEYKFVSSNTMKSDCMIRYQIEKDVLKKMLDSSNTRVCLTIDLWTSAQDLPYMALRAHFIDNEWKLHKRIINFVAIPANASGQNLADIVIDCLLDWNMENICTVTLEDCTTNDVLARTLSKHYSSKGSLLLQGRAIQVLCWGQVLNVIVKEGLDEVKDSICRIRNAVKYVKLSSKRKVELLQYADLECIPRKEMLVLDTCTQWDTTYKMLGSALHYKRAYNGMRSHDLHFRDPPTPEDWEKAKIIYHFLETFSIVTNTFSRSKYCTSNVYFREIYRILTLLDGTATDLGSLLGRMALNMLVKFERYWKEKEPNILLSIAAVLDPRLKLRYLRFCFNKIYDSSLLEDLMGHVEEELRSLFAKYEVSCRLRDSSSSRGEMEISSVTSPFSLKKSTDFMEEFYKFNEEEDISQSKTELDVYLEEALHRSKLSCDEEEFDILQWWKVNSCKFPVLSRMARNVLAIPVSSVASERAFSTDSRVLNKFLSALLPSTIEALVCTQDWIRGEPVHNEFEQETDTAFTALNVSKDLDSA